MPIVMHHERIWLRRQPHIKYSIVGIQNHAIRCYKSSRSWFENHPFQFATITTALGVGIGWVSKTWWDNRK